MPAQQWTQSGETIKLPFQRISLRVMHHNSFVFTDGSPRIVAIQLVIIPKKIVREALNIPNTTD